MRWLVPTVIIIAAFADSACAQATKFPYEAVVQTDEAYVRSGPGNSYYPTAKLQRGQRVTVNRHDPGGWYMIAPPVGSFSYIRTEYVQQTAQNRGVVTDNNVVVRVGTSFGEVHEVEQRRLSKGDEVEILARKTLTSDRGAIAMFLIKPPRGEYRWIAGHLVARPDAVPLQTNRNPSPTPSNIYDLDPPSSNKTGAGIRNIEGPIANSTGVPVRERPVTRISHDGAIQRTAPPAEDIEKNRQRLAQLDAAFRGIIKQETADWDFTALEGAYTELQKQAAVPAIASQVDLRLKALTRYKRIKREYDDYIRLTSETEERDAQLVKLRNERAKKETTNNAIPPQPAPANAPAPTPPANRPTERKFDGAGVVQRSAITFPGGPSHVLIAPNGRILAYLDADQGINLNGYLGRAVGIFGERQFRSDIQADHIRVRGLTPVQLRP